MASCRQFFARAGSTVVGVSRSGRTTGQPRHLQMSRGAMRHRPCDIFWRGVLLVVLGALSGSPSLASEAEQLVLWRQVALPIANITRYSSHFGWRKAPFGSRREFHNGLDLPAPLGSPVHAWAEGVVQSVRYDGRCGLHLRIVSGNWSSLYCHLSRVDVAVGALIQTGQLVAAVGNSGRSTGAHLHWTLRYEGKLVDPELVIQAMRLSWLGEKTPAVEPAPDIPEVLQQDVDPDEAPFH